MGYRKAVAGGWKCGECWEIWGPRKAAFLELERGKTGLECGKIAREKGGYMELERGEIGLECGKNAG